MELLIYGAGGYTGEIIARRAAAKGVKVVLAGRERDRVTALATELSLPHRIFELDDPTAVAAGLAGVRAVIHCAGPFSHTARPMVDACLRAGVHYLDITGEISVLEGLAARDAEAKAAKVTILPGAGFDVVPSDCLASHVAKRLPTATHLAVAVVPTTTLSRGSMLTLLEIADIGSLIRAAGKLTRIPRGWRTWRRTRLVDFGDGPRRVITMPLGDVASAFYTTGIGNVDFYVALPLARRVGMMLSRALVPFMLSFPSVRRWLERVIARRPPGPTAAQRAQNTSILWAEARDDKGAVARARLHTPEVYEFSAWTALDLGERAVRGELPVGFQTPARACGADYVLQFSGVRREDVN
jgi:short subunit dehydrogenase-like uncharacterized protein